MIPFIKFSVSYFLPPNYIKFDLSLVYQECPHVNSLPTLTSNGEKFYCAFNWKDRYPWHHQIPLEACKGPSQTQWILDHHNGVYDGNDGIFGALIVKAGCTLTGFSVIKK